jgi:hypothetical protein
MQDQDDLDNNRKRAESTPVNRGERLIKNLRTIIFALHPGANSYHISSACRSGCRAKRPRNFSGSRPLRCDTRENSGTTRRPDAGNIVVIAAGKPEPDATLRRCEPNPSTRVRPHSQVCYTAVASRPVTVRPRYRKGEGFLQAVEQVGLEGMVAKRRRSEYAGTLTEDSLKVRCPRTYDFVVGGWIPVAKWVPCCSASLLTVISATWVRWVRRPTRA